MALWATTELLLHSTQAVVTVPRATITHTDSRHTQQGDVRKPEAKNTEGARVKVFAAECILCLCCYNLSLHVGENKRVFTLQSQPHYTLYENRGYIMELW